ncbi:helix-turn-helix domain-containing protein [Streptomyces sp. RS10V-4]|uniref:helix-turn-helix domain-containing protein n=1 Tax=Streptomyces rhizoryzae TaxID=2932493 RepID=UPI002005E52B|nr:helix-turn-helix domain-containing protein [Streptomyces rhizoryzae]MCK7626511.1 helix-turn-helix domain-containing protein [Streptomyces rhizoryzae]
MSGDQLDSVEALLEEARLAARMPDPAERLRLREAAGLSRAQVAAAVGVGRQTIANWESGVTDPQRPGRVKYLRLLEGLAQIHPAPEEAASLPREPQPGGRSPSASAAASSVPTAASWDFTAQTAWRSDGLAAQGEPGPCVRCGVVTPFRSTDGRPLHAGAMCRPGTAAPLAAAAPQHATTPATTPANAPAPAPVVPAPTRPPSPSPAPPSGERQAQAPSASPTPAPLPSRPQRRAQSAARAQSETGDLIARAVHEELQRAEGDADAALQALVKRAIPDVMRLFEETRATARYQYTAYPSLPDILHKPSKREPDQIWEARPNFHHPHYSLKAPGDIRVTALDANAAYLSALKCWLPIGKLEHHSGSDGVDPKRSGVHLITPAPWTHPHLPDPLGDREEPGALWITDATLRLLLRLSGPKYGLTDPPTVHESWTSGATENFLDALRKVLAAARETALAQDDSLTEGYVKAMYSKFISTMGESVHNREIQRPDWMHIIHSQAYANLWGKAYKAHQAGLEVIAMMGTDELHVSGDWRRVFPEGRGLAQMKIKYSDTAKASGEYTVGKVTG